MITFPNYHDPALNLGHNVRAWRQRAINRWSPKPTRMPIPAAERLWPRCPAKYPRSARWPLNIGRWYAARIMWMPGAILPAVAMPAAHTFIPGVPRLAVLAVALLVTSFINQRRGFCDPNMYNNRLARVFVALSIAAWWVITPFVGLLAVMAALVASLVVWLPTAAASTAIKVVALLKGWHPPVALNHNDMAFLERSAGTPLPAPVKPVASNGASGWDNQSDPHLAAQWAAIDEMRRTNAILERDTPEVVDVSLAAVAQPRVRPSKGPYIVVGIGVVLLLIGAYKAGTGAHVPQPASWQQINAEVTQ